MAKSLTPKTALVLFILMIIFLLAQAVWWVVFMATLVDEKVELAQELGATDKFIEQIHQEEISRQIMVGLEGVFFLIVLLVGLWLIYRSIVRLHQLRFHQENFMMAVTHELKTPLSSINIYLDSLQSAKIADDKKSLILPKMKEDVKRLQKLVDNVLEASRFERSRLINSHIRFNFSQLVQERLTAIKKVPSQIPIRPEHNLEENIFVAGDRESLARVIDLILENSIKYNEGDNIRIKVRLYIHENYVVLEIIDNGIGLDKKEQKVIFDRFYRVGNEMTRRFDGTGLGLYLSREIIRAHGGTIDAFSEGPDKGTTFTIKLNKD